MVATDVRTSSSVAELNKVAREMPPSLVAAVTRLMGSVATHEAQATLVSRVLDALTRSISEGNLSDPMEVDQQSHLAVLINWLNRPEVLADLRQTVSPITVARLRGLAVKEKLLAAEGGALSAKEMAHALGITRQAVDARRKRGALIGLTMGKRGFVYPSWQLGLEGLDAVLYELQGLDPWSQLAFLLTSNVWLDGDRPIDALRNGDFDLAVDAARTHGQQVAA